MQEPAVQESELVEYLLVISPERNLFERIRAIKEHFAKEFHAALAKATDPQIALVKFYSIPMKEDKIIRRINGIAATLKPFKIELKNFGSLPSHTIHINVTSRLQVNELVREIKSAQSLMKYNNEFKPHFMEDPHITICHKLKPWQYEQAWLKYAQENFSGRFIADEILLLKKTYDEKYFHVYRRFPFTGVGIKAEQGQLFA